MVIVWATIAVPLTLSSDPRSGISTSVGFSLSVVDAAAAPDERGLTDVVFACFVV